MDLGDVLDASDDAVVTLVAGETRLVAHRAVLVHRSPVFNAMFSHDTLESRSGLVNIVDVEGPVLRQLLSFLYTLRAPQLIDIDMVIQLLAAADKYWVAGLKAACEQQVAVQLTVETAAAAAVLAVAYSCKSLREDAIHFIGDHKDEVKATEGWNEAACLQPKNMAEVSRLIGDPPADTSGPAPAASGASSPPCKRRRRTAPSAAPATAASRHTPSADDAVVSRLSSPTPADSSQPPGHTGDTASTAAPLPQPPPASLPRLMAPQSLTCESSTMSAVDLGALLDAGEDALVTLVAGQTRLVAHRAVLVHRSPVFASVFRDDTLESRGGQVNIVDVEGPVLRQLVSYLYTLRAPQLIEIDAVTQLLAAADKYGVTGLEAAWEQQVAAQLSVETAAAAAVLAVRLSWESLRQASIAFLTDHTRQVMATRGWADAMGSQPHAFMEVKRLLVAKMRMLPADARSRRLREAAQQGAVAELEALLEARANVAGRDWVTRWTALHHAARGGHAEVARLLLEWGAKVDALGGGRTALPWAAREGHAEVARLLLEWGAKVDARDSRQRTPLHEAASSGHVAVVRLLLAHSADHSARTDWGGTPLHCAAFWGHREAAAALLDAGADRAARDNRGRTPLDLAREWNRQQLVELLEET